MLVVNWLDGRVAMVTHLSLERRGPTADLIRESICSMEGLSYALPCSIFGS